MLIQKYMEIGKQNKQDCNIFLSKSVIPCSSRHGGLMIVSRHLPFSHCLRPPIVILIQRGEPLAWNYRGVGRPITQATNERDRTCNRIHFPSCVVTGSQQQYVLSKSNISRGTFVIICNCWHFFSELRVFREWLRYNFGVFPEAGFSGDDKYPETFEIGDEVRENLACKDLLALDENRKDETPSHPAPRNLGDFNGFPFHHLVSYALLSEKRICHRNAFKWNARKDKYFWGYLLPNGVYLPPDSTTVP